MADPPARVGNTPNLSRLPLRRIIADKANFPVLARALSPPANQW
jgi:hypothetical protein